MSSQFEISNLCECINSWTGFHVILLNLSHCPFSCGWYGVVVEILIPISFEYFLIDVDRNPDPLSECIILGVPKVAKNSWFILIAVLNDVFLQGEAQGNRLNSSTIVNSGTNVVSELVNFYLWSLPYVLPGVADRVWEEFIRNWLPCTFSKVETQVIA